MFLFNLVDLKKRVQYHISMENLMQNTQMNTIKLEKIKYFQKNAENHLTNHKMTIVFVAKHTILL